MPPGTRRGVVPNAAAVAFVRALATLEAAITRELDQLDQRRRADADRHLVEELRKAMRGLRERMPHYDLPAVDHGDETREPAAKGAELAKVEPENALQPQANEQPTEQGQPQLFPPGPLASVTIKPPTIEILLGGERRVTAYAYDADGRRITHDVEFTWSIEDDAFEMIGEHSRPLIRVGDVPAGTEATISVVARQGELVADASARVVAVESRKDHRAGLGIPKPELIDASGSGWRSRMENGSWQVNAGHEDYLGLEDGRSRLRYLVALLGKEIVQRTYAQPGAGELLEHLIAVIAHAERNLRN